jgi:hypothetical protein
LEQSLDMNIRMFFLGRWKWIEGVGEVQESPRACLQGEVNSIGSSTFNGYLQ